MKHINAGGEGHKAGCGAMWVDVTYLWDEVTCPECLKLRPTKRKTMRQIISVICLALSVMACGVSAGTQPESKISIKVNTPSLEPAPTPIRAVTESADAIACGGLWVRYGAGVEYGVAGFALKGDTLHLTDAAPRQAKDGGIWQQVVDRDGSGGWVNSKLLCEVE